MKICNKCNKEYPPIEKYFYKHRNYKDGLSATCKKCHNQYCMEYRKGQRGNKRVKRNPNNIKIKPMARGIPYGKKPIEALDKAEIENLSFKEGKTYLVKYKPGGKGNGSTETFKGDLIQQTKDFIILKNKLGIRESFLKVDFMIGSQIKEVK